MTTYARYLIGLLVLVPLAACNRPTDPTARLYQPPEVLTPAVPAVNRTVTPAVPRTPACRPVPSGGGCKTAPAGGGL